jgi:hypothetical protein
MGMQYKKDNLQAGVNAAINIYNNGIGTTSGSTGRLENRANFILSPSFTIGNGQAPLMPLNTFNGLTETGVKNSFANSFTLGKNFILDSGGRNQHTSSLGVRFGNTSFHTFNDMKGNGFFGDGGDRYNTANFELTRIQDGFTYSFGNVMYTGEKWWNKNGDTKTFLYRGDKYYLQPSLQDFLLNNGETYLTTRSASGVFVDRRWASGAGHLLPQRIIHAILDVPYFFSVAKDESNVAGSFVQREMQKDLMNYNRKSNNSLKLPGDEKFNRVIDNLPRLGSDEVMSKNPFEMLNEIKNK